MVLDAALAIAELVLQQQPTPPAEPNPGAAAGGGALGAFLSTLIVGGILVFAAPDYVESRVRALADHPLACFAYGFVLAIVIAVIAVILVVTIIGIPVAILLGIVVWLLWAVGSAIGYLAIANRLVGHEGGWLLPLLVAALINGVLTLTVIGGLVSLLVGTAGFGAVLRGLLR